MTAMNATIEALPESYTPTLADLRRADQTRRAIKAGQAPSLEDLRHLTAIRKGQAPPAPEAPDPMRDVLGFRPGSLDPSMSSQPADATTYPDGVKTLGADARGQTVDPGAATFAPGAVPADLDALGGLARSPFALAKQGAGLLVGAEQALAGPFAGTNAPTGPALVRGISRAADQMAPAPQTFLGRAAEQAMPLAAGIAGGAALGGTTALGRTLASGAVAGAQSAGGTAAGAIDRGLSPEQAAKEAAVSGVTGAVTGALPLGRFASRLAGGNPVGGVLGDVAAQAAAGTAQSLADAAAASWIEQNPDQWRQAVAGMGETAAMNLVLGLVGHGATAGGGKAEPGAGPGGAREGAGSTLRPGEASTPTAPIADQAQARAAEPPPANEPPNPARQPAATETPNPAAVEPRNGQETQGRQEGLLRQPVPASPGELTPGAAGASVGSVSEAGGGGRGVRVPPTPPGVDTPGEGVAKTPPRGEPVRSTDTLAPGDTLTDPAGKPFTVRTVLDGGKVVARAEDGAVIRRTAGELEARGWSKVHEGAREVYIGVQGENTPRQEVAGNGMNRSESPNSSPRLEKSRSATPEVAPDKGGQTRTAAESTRTAAELPAPPEPTEPGFLASLRERAQARIAERAAAQREAEAKFKGKGGRRGSGGSLDPQTIADRAIILATHVAEAGIAGAKAIKAKAIELFGEHNPAVFRAAVGMLREGQGPDGKPDMARLELAAHDALTEAQAKARTAPNESADVREMMAKREGDRKAAEAKAEGKQNVQDAREAEQYLRRDAVAAERAKAQLKADAAEATRKEQAARDKTRMDVAVGLERQAGEQSAAMREGMAKKAGEVALSKAAEKARQDRQDLRDAFALKADDQKATRQALAKLAEDQLSPADRAKVLRTIASASSDADARRAVERILNVEKVAELRDARKELKDTTGKAKQASTIPQPSLASQINQAQGVKVPPKNFRAGRIGSREVAKLRTPYRDALAPVVEAVRNDHTTGVGKLADFLQAETDAGKSNAFDDAALNVLRSADGKLLSELNPQQLRTVNDAIEHAAFLSDNANKAQVLGERRDLEALRTDAIHDVRERWGTKEAINPGRTMGKLAQTVKDFVVTDQDTLSTMVATVAGKDTTAHRVLYENVAKGESAQRLALRRAMDASGLKDWSARDMAAVNKDREITYSGGKVKLKGWEMMEVVAAWNDPSTRKELETAGFVRQVDRGSVDRKLFFTDRDITAIEAAMTPKERGAIDPLRAALKEAYAEANDAHERMNGFRLPDTANHWSRTRDIAGTEREISGDLAKAARQHHWFEDAGIFKDRSTSKAPIVIRNPFEWVPDQLHTLTGMAHLAEPIRAARRVMADPEVKTEFTRKGGDNWVRTFENRLASLVRTPGDTSTANQLGQAALGIMARSKLAWRLSSVVKQKLGFLQAAAAAADKALGARIIAAGVDVRNMTPGARAALRAEVNARSGYLADRADPAFAASLATAANPHLVTSSSRLVRGYQALERAGMAGLQYADGDVVLGTYKAVRDHLAKTKGLTGDALKDAAVWETEKIIRESQNPTSPLDMSGLHLSGRKNAGIGFMTLFTSSANKIRNQMRQASSDVAADPSPANVKKLAQVTTLTAANAVASNLIGRVTKGSALAAAIAWLWGDRMDKKDDQNAVGILADLADTAQPGLGEAIRLPSGQSYANGGYLSTLWNATSQAVKTFGDEDARGVDKADKVLRAVRALEVLPDAPLDYAGQVAKGIAGPTPSPTSIKAALDRGDTAAVKDRIDAYLARKAAQKPKDFTEPKDASVRQQEAANELRGRILRLSGTKFDKLSEEQRQTLAAMDASKRPAWYAEELAKWRAWKAKVAPIFAGRDLPDLPD